MTDKELIVEYKLTDRKNILRKWENRYEFSIVNTNYCCETLEKLHESFDIDSSNTEEIIEYTFGSSHGDYDNGVDIFIPTPKFCPYCNAKIIFKKVKHIVIEKECTIEIIPEQTVEKCTTKETEVDF